jgi:hypothetical protein
VPGEVGQVVQTPKSGRVPQVGVEPFGREPGRIRANSWQGSHEFVCVLTGGAGHNATTKAVTGRITCLDDLTGAGWWSRPAPMPGKEVIAAIRSLPGKAEVKWQQIDDERYPFAFGEGAFIEGFCALPLLYGDLQLRKVVPRRCGSSAQTEARMPPRRMACLPARSS